MNVCYFISLKAKRFHKTLTVEKVLGTGIEPVRAFLPTGF